MSKSRTKVLAVLLALAAAMMLSALFCLWQPIQARADTQETALQAKIDAAESGATITLTENVTENITIPAGKEITLDLGGYTLSSDVASKATVLNNGTLIIEDSVGGGVITRGVTKYYVIRNEGVLTLGEGITVKNENASDTSSLVGNNISCKKETPATLTIHGRRLQQCGKQRDQER